MKKLKGSKTTTFIHDEDIFVIGRRMLKNLKDDAVKEIEESRKKNFKELISHEAMKKEFA